MTYPNTYMKFTFIPVVIMTNSFIKKEESTWTLLTRTMNFLSTAYELGEM